LSIKGIDLTRAYTRADSLADFASAVSVMLGRPIVFQDDGALSDPQSLIGLDSELTEMVALLAGKLAHNHPPAAHNVIGLLQDLTGRKSLSRPDVQDRLAQLDLDWPRKMILVTLHPANQQQTLPDSITSLLKQLAGPDWVWLQKGDLHALIHDEAIAGWHSSGDSAVRAAATEVPLSGCISDEFQDLMRLSDIYQANTRIAGIIEKITRQPMVVDYDRFKQADLILTAASAPGFNYRQYVCRPVAAIFAYDRQHGTDFLYTLYCFLTSASSFVVTARKMHLHKNTVSYRIHRMQELFKLDLETIESKFDMVFSCYILRIFDEA